jgi:hypothetical protein
MLFFLKNYLLLDKMYIQPPVMLFDVGVQRPIGPFNPDANDVGRKTDISLMNSIPLVKVYVETSVREGGIRMRRHVGDRDNVNE